MTADGIDGLPEGEPVVYTKDLVKRYGRRTALTGLSMAVAQGEVFGFLGPNGAGKTTAVKLLLGLLSPTSGEGWVLGEPLGAVGARRRIGYLPEHFRYQDWLTAREVLAFHLALLEWPRDEWDAIIRRRLEVVGLLRRADDRVGTFSKGMTQRLGLAVALVGDPTLVFVDEPTSALDPVGRHDVREVIRDLKAEGVTVFLNSHLLTEVEQVADRVAIVRDGTVIATGALDEILSGDALRIRVSGLPDGAVSALSRFGQVSREGPWLTVGNCREEDIPAVVRLMVEAGGDVSAVEPGRQSLEDRFLDLLRGESS